MVPRVSKSLDYPPPPPATSRIRLVLLATWTALTVAAVGYVLALGSNCPNADEWEFVPALTGHEPLGPWLWAQHNEHRLPLPRLVYYGLFQVTHDFRAGSILQIALLAATSLGLMSLASRLRGRPYWTDLFFPVSLVHVGHWENFLIGYNLCFAFILVLETALGLVALSTTRETLFRSGVKAGVLMVLLCLCGGGGVVAAIPVALWLALMAVQEWNGSRRAEPRQGPGRTPIQLSDQVGIVNAIDPTASPEEKVRQLVKLTDANQPLVDAFLRNLDAEFGTKSNSNVKAPASIVAKASSPSIRTKKPWHDVEHIRDSFRFKTVLKDLRDLPAILDAVEANLGATIIKRDTRKFLEPLGWGWRIVAFDLRMPNGQLVEYYLPVAEMERAKKEGNHELFEKWRNRDLETLGREERMEMFADQAESQSRYEAAFASFLTRTGSSESDLRAALSSVSHSSGHNILNSSPSGSSLGEKSNTGTQVSPPSRVDAANPPRSSTQARPSPSRDIPPTAMIIPPANILAESGLRAKRFQAAVLLAFAAFPFAYLAVYLQGYNRPGHHPEVGDGGLDVLRVAGQVLSMSFGYGTFRWWIPIFAGIVALGSVTIWTLFQDAKIAAKRPASLGLIAIAAGIVGVALVIGMGRAGLDAKNGLASRYTYLTWPLLALAYIVWTSRGGRLGKWIPAALAALAALAFNPNMITGIVRGLAIKQVLSTIENEARDGVPPERIVRHFHNTFQAHQEERAIRAIPMLQEARIGVFGEARP